MPESRRTAAFCALVAVAVSGVAIVVTISVQRWQLSALVHMSATEPLAPLARATDPNFAFVDPSAHYDGVYFYAIARDPFATGEEHRLIDAAAYRYGHAGYGWLAGALSLGRASFVPFALPLLSLAGMGVAAAAASSIASKLGWTGWAGLFVALHPGLIYAVTVDTSEPVGAAILALALLAWLRGKWKLAIPLLAGLCLVKEWFVLVPAGLGLWETVQWLRGRRSKDLLQRLVWLALSPGAFVLWYLYLRARFGRWPFADFPDPRGLLQLPLSGWIETLELGARMANGAGDGAQLGQVSVPLLITMGALIFFAMVRALRFKTPIDAVYLMFLPFVFTFRWWGLLYPKDLLRELAIPLALVPAVAIAPRLVERRSRGQEEDLPSHSARSGVAANPSATTSSTPRQR